MADELSYTQHMKEFVAQRAHIFNEADQKYHKEQQVKKKPFVNIMTDIPGLRFTRNF